MWKDDFRKTALAGAGVLAACVMTYAHAFYPVEVHERITTDAAERSTLNDPSTGILTALWLGTSVSDGTFTLAQDIAITSELTIEFAYTPLEWLETGAREEDSGTRPLHHFFDPQQGGTGLTALGSEIGRPSPTWILEDEETVAGQIWSYRDAKVYLAAAIHRPTKAGRDNALADTFRALGHVVHHIQDMAQPQHVRDDDHLIPFRTSGYERYVGTLGADLPVTGYAVDRTDFPQPKRLWIGDGTGLAEFTSHNFVSIATNFEGSLAAIIPDTDHQLPAAPVIGQDVVPVDITDFVGPYDPHLQPLQGEIWFLPTVVEDKYPTEHTTSNPLASTYSIFNEDLIGRGFMSTFSLNRFNYEMAAQLLVPRASAYSTALLDHFFRGRIEVAPPPSGVYGVLDHATVNASQSGFERLTVRLRNASDGLSMAGGSLRAYVRYYRNPCYDPNLLGEWRFAVVPLTWNGCGATEYFDVVDEGNEESSSSTQLTGQVLGAEFTEVVFDFSSAPIPVDAYDVRLQVVYEGEVGGEADAIALGGKNLSEPTYFGIMNATDYFNIDGTFYTPAEIEADPVLLELVDGFDYHEAVMHAVRYEINGVTVAGTGSLPPREFHRIAVLADDGASIPIVVTGFIEGAEAFALSRSLPVATNQFEREPLSFWWTNEVRGAIAHWTLGLFKGIGADATSEAFFALPPIVPGCHPSSGCAASPWPIEIAGAP